MTERTAPDGVSLTAVSVAVARAWESRQQNRLFDDPLALTFLTSLTGKLDPAFPINPTTNPDVLANAEYVAVRTRYFDNFLRDATLAGCRQVVILAAGLDTRAFRLAWPTGVRLYEVDLPNLVQFKEAILREERTSPRCVRVVTVADLRDDWPGALSAVGLLATEPTAWLAEGLLPYFTQSECDHLLNGISKLSAPGSRMAAEHFSAATVEQIIARPAMAALSDIGAAWRSTLEDPRGWLAGHGWKAAAQRAREVATVHDRRLAQDYGSTWLVSAEWDG